MVSTKDFSYLTLRLSLLNPGNVGRIRTGTGTSTCPACMYYKTKSIATFTAEQFINSILYYHCAHSNQLMLPTGYEPGFAKLQILSFLYMLLNYRILQGPGLISHGFTKSSPEVKLLLRARSNPLTLEVLLC